jgi:hypothetical protein
MGVARNIKTSNNNTANLCAKQCLVIQLRIYYGCTVISNIFLILVVLKMRYFGCHSFCTKKKLLNYTLETNFAGLNYFVFLVEATLISHPKSHLRVRDSSSASILRDCPVREVLAVLSLIVK